MPLDLLAPADLLTVWMLFPEDRPYRSYRLLRYPADNDAQPEPMTPRYSIDHPYGTLIGWSVINPRRGRSTSAAGPTDRRRRRGRLKALRQGP